MKSPRPVNSDVRLLFFIMKLSVSLLLTLLALGTALA
jgi:hypothetical protein